MNNAHSPRVNAIVAKIMLAGFIAFSISSCSTKDVKVSEQAMPSAKADSSKSMTKLKKEEPTVSLLPAGSDPIPFSLKDIDGNVVSLDNYLGDKAVIIAFWSFFCGPCREEIPQLDQIAKKYMDQDLVMLAVNLDGPKLEKAIRKYTIDGGFSFTVLWEEVNGGAYKTADAYGVDGTPTLVFVGKNKKVSWSHVGKEKPEIIESEIRKAIGL